MNEIHEDDDRFMVVRSLFKEEHPELLYGKIFTRIQFTPRNALLAPINHPAGARGSRQVTCAGGATDAS